MAALRDVVRAVGLTGILGLAAWLGIALVAWRTDAEALDLVTVLLLFAQLVAVPMGLGLLRAPRRSTLANGLFRFGRAGMAPGAVAALLSLAVPRGELAAAVAALYLVPALLIGAGMLVGARTTPLPSVLAGVALAAGALLFVLHRQDVAFSWLPELGVQLASVHLHYVGFALVAMAGAAATRGSRVAAAAAVMLAAGAALSPLGELLALWGRVAAVILVAVGVALLSAGTLARLADRRVSPASRRLLFASVAVSAYVVGAVVVGLVASPVAGASLDAGSTVRLHGTFGALGVVFVGLIGWRLATSQRR